MPWIFLENIVFFNTTMSKLKYQNKVDIARIQLYNIVERHNQTKSKLMFWPKFGLIFFNDLITKTYQY